jgi:hypothetical protein
VAKRLLDGTFLAIGVVVVLDEMTDEPSVLGLLGEECAEAEGVEDSPSEGVSTVSGEKGGRAERRGEGGEQSVGDDEQGEEVGRSARRIKGSSNQYLGGMGLRGEEKERTGRCQSSRK